MAEVDQRGQSVDVQTNIVNVHSTPAWVIVAAVLLVVAGLVALAYLALPRNGTHGGQVAANTNLAVQKLDLEIGARIEAALNGVEQTARINWLDGTTNTGEGAALAFAGNHFRAVLFHLDQSAPSDAAYRGKSLMTLIQDLKAGLSAAEQLEVDGIVPKYRELKVLAEQMPLYEDTSRRMTRDQVATTRNQMRAMVLALRLPRWRLDAQATTAPTRPTAGLEIANP